MAELRFGKAINEALAVAMAADDAIVLLGEDIGEAGGPFGVTRGLAERFGADRVLDTPISEAAIVGAAVGAAATGLRPVVEIMFMDFITLGMDALANQAAKAHFMFGGQRSIPMVLRTPHGGGVNAGPQHSQCLEAWLAHVPGLKVVVPATAADAYGLMLSAIADPNPVIFIENKALYALKEQVAVDLQPIPIGKARIDREGRDVTVVTYGAMLYPVRDAAAMLEAENVSVEILDLRSLQPWDEAAVLASLARTHRLVVVHEAVLPFGPGAEIAARMADIGFDELDAPIKRVGSLFSPLPFSKSLEAAFRPDAARIAAEIRETLA